MRLLLDECCSILLAERLRTDGHDVVHVLEFGKGAPDSAVLLLSSSQDRLLVTEDKDFGELVVRFGMRTAGTLLLRMENQSVEQKWERLRALLEDRSEKLLGAHSVLEPQRFRPRLLESGPERRDD